MWMTVSLKYDTNEMVVTQNGLNINDPSIWQHQGYKVGRHIWHVSSYGGDEENEGVDEDAAHHHFALVPGFLD